MLPEKTYKAVVDALDVATKAMMAHGNAEIHKDLEDAMIYKRLLQVTLRTIKRGKKAQKLEQNRKHAA